MKTSGGDSRIDKNSSSGPTRLGNVRAIIATSCLSFVLGASVVLGTGFEDRIPFAHLLGYSLALVYGLILWWVGLDHVLSTYASLLIITAEFLPSSVDPAHAIQFVGIVWRYPALPWIAHQAYARQFYTAVDLVLVVGLVNCHLVAFTTRGLPSRTISILELSKAFQAACDKNSGSIPSLESWDAAYQSIQPFGADTLPVDVDSFEPKMLPNEKLSNKKIANIARPRGTIVFSGSVKGSRLRDAVFVDGSVRRITFVAMFLNGKPFTSLGSSSTSRRYMSLGHLSNALFLLGQIFLIIAFGQMGLMFAFTLGLFSWMCLWQGAVDIIEKRSLRVAGVIINGTVSSVGDDDERDSASTAANSTKVFSVTYEVVAETGVRTFRAKAINHRLRVGDKVPVWYLPENPEISTTVDPKTATAPILLIVGAITLIAEWVLLFVKVARPFGGW